MATVVEQPTRTTAGEKAGDGAAAAASTQAATVPAPWAHALLAVLYFAPIVLPVPTNANIVVTAAATVLVGCLRSVKPEPPQESMSRHDAMRFPVVGSAVLFSLFLAFKFLPKHIVNAILSAYFVLLGLAAVVACAEPLVAPLLPASLASKEVELRLPAIPFVLKEGLELRFTQLEGLLALPAAGLCGWYFARRHWAASNLLGLAFSVQGIEHLSLGAVQNGVILLAGLFVYDIFWVFATPVMVSVAKNFDAPIKLLFPRHGADAGLSPFSMLGLGDIVIPGIFVALILRYDAHREFRTAYFRSAFGGYVAGLVATIVVMNVFQAAQPALLYIVPCVLGATFLHAAMRGELAALLHWQESEEEGGKEKHQSGGKEAVPASPARITRAAAAAAAAAAAEGKKES